MRVVHVIPVMDPKTGGPPAVVAAVASVQRRMGIDARVVCYEVPAGRERVAGLMGEAGRGAEQIQAGVGGPSVAGASRLCSGQRPESIRRSASNMGGTPMPKTVPDEASIGDVEGVSLGGVGVSRALGPKGQDVSPLRVERGRDAHVTEEAGGISPGVPIDYLPPLTRWEVPTASNARRLLPGMLAGMGGADVVHLHGVWDPVILAASKAARRLGIPYVISTHGMLEPWAIDQKRWKKELFWRLGWGAMLQGAAGIHDYRPGPIRVLGRELRPKVWVIANGIFPGRVPTREETRKAWEVLCERFPVLRGRKILLFLGRLSEQKGAHIAMLAMQVIYPETKGHADVALLMVGADYGQGQLPDIILERPHLIERIVLAGPLFGKEKDAVMAHADFFVAPSEHEGFSMSVLEAMNAGLPTIITAACHFPRAIEVGAAELLEEPIIGRLAEPVWRFVTKPEYAAEVGRRGRELVEREYTWGAIVPGYQEMYAGVVGGGN